MHTVADAVKTQEQQGVLTTPSSSTSASTSSPTVPIILKNNTSSANVYVSISGLQIDGSKVWLLQSDGATGYNPGNPPADGQLLAVDCAIKLGSPGSTRTVRVPRLAGARIWYSEDVPLKFRLNRGADGPSLVEPSVTNKSDDNYMVRWDFCEFTYNNLELYANISYVDFVSIPTALSLASHDGSDVKTVAGLTSDGLDTICQSLQDQQRKDCAGWDRLVVQTKTDKGTSFLRALSPNCAMVDDSSLFAGYYEPYVDAVWEVYTKKPLTIDTQSAWGVVKGQVNASTGMLEFQGIGSFPKPSTADIFSCSTGAFGPYNTNSGEMGNLTARISAAFNRSTLLTDSVQPSPTTDYYYVYDVTNHYARIIHAANLDGRGYAFSYDDVRRLLGLDQSGSVSSNNPAALTVYIGGGDDDGPATASKSRSLEPHPSNPIRLHNELPHKTMLLRPRGEDAHQHQRRSVPPPPPPPPAEEDAMIMAPFMGDVEGVEMQTVAQAQTLRPFSSFPAVDPEKQLLQQNDDKQLLFSQVDPEKGLGPMAAPSRPDLATRLLALIHSAVVSLCRAIWAAVCAVWALVPRGAAVPIERAVLAAAAYPPVAALASSVFHSANCVYSSTAASTVAALLVRPLVVRGIVTGLLMLLTFGAGSVVSPLLLGVVGWLEQVVGAFEEAE